MTSAQVVRQASRKGQDRYRGHTMGKIGKARHRQRKRDEKDLDMHPQVQDLEQWGAPDRSTWDPDGYNFTYLPSPTAKISHRADRLNGRLVDYAVMLACKDAQNEWKEIYRIDCSGGTVHRHTWLKEMKDHELIRQVTRQEDIEDTYSESCSEVEDRWDDLERRWRDGH